MSFHTSEFRQIEGRLMDEATDLGFREVPEEIMEELCNTTTLSEEFGDELSTKLRRLADSAQEVTDCCEAEPYDDREFCTECYRKDPSTHLVV